MTNNQQRYLEAAAWVEQLADVPLDNLTRNRLQQWLTADIQNRELLERMITTWGSDQLTDVLRYVNETTPLRDKLKLTNRHWWFTGSLVSLSFVVLLVWSVGLFETTSPADLLKLETPTKQHAEYILNEGSVVNLDAKSKLVLLFDNDQRRLNLQAGNAYFSVQKDPSRPFNVKVGRSSVVAVGTEFTINRSTHFIDVAVYEGAVEVYADETSKPQILSSGEQVRITQATLGKIKSFDVATAIDWRSGWIEIENESLGYLIEQLQRHSQKRITVKNTAINSLRIAGRYRISDTQQTLSQVAQLHGLVMSEDAQSITLSN